MKIRNIILASACMLIGSHAIAQEAALPIASEAPVTETSNQTATPAMWRVADEDSEFILMGTFHILPPELQWRTDTLNAAVKNAEAVYFELEADAPNAQSITVNTVMLKGFNPVGVTLTSMISDAEGAKLEAICTELGLPFDAINAMRPWNAFLTMSVQFIINQGFTPGAGVDTTLLAESRTLGKELRFLETMEEQLALFTELDSQVEKKLLTITIRDWDNQKESFDGLFHAWANGDATVIDQQMNEFMRNEAPQVYQRLIVDRNIAWAERLDQDLKNETGRALVAVGVGHLVGDEFSVPALLAAKGYDVTPYGEWANQVANDNAPQAEE